MSDTGLLAALIGGMIGLVLSVPAFWGILKWIEYRDMTRIERWTKKQEKKR
jgi:hypothetical protein